MNTSLTVATACDWSLWTIQWLFSCIEKQSKLPDRIVLLIYTKQTKEEYDAFILETNTQYQWLSQIIEIYSSHNSSHISGKYHGYDRQFLVEQSTTTAWNSNDWLLLMIDSDNEFDDDFIQSLYDEFILLESSNTELMLAPTVINATTWVVQSQGVKHYSFLIPKYQFANFSKQHSPQQVLMMWWNCLFAKLSTFKKVWFDALFAWSYEDIDFTYRLTQSWIPLYVTATTMIFHHERALSSLEHKRIATPQHAYRRMKNYVLFVRKNATWFQKIQAYCFSIWWLYFWFILTVVVSGTTHKRKLINALSRGLTDWVINWRWLHH